MNLQVHLSYLLTPYVPFSSCFAGFLGCFSAAESLHNEHSGEVDIFLIEAHIDFNDLPFVIC